MTDDTGSPVDDLYSRQAIFRRRYRLYGCTGSREVTNANLQNDTMVQNSKTPPSQQHCKWAAILTIFLFIGSASTFDLNRQDRFRLMCPADLNSIRRFEPTLVADVTEENNSNHVWVAVYRSYNNKPSVLVKDEFLQAMNTATTTSSATSDPQVDAAFSPPVGIAASSPVAVARLRHVNDDEDDAHFVLDAMRCILTKENMDPDCDGGSEHTEALATAIDGLVQHYLDNIMSENRSPCFENSIRAKATLFSAPLLEDRGFIPVTELNKYMLTHVSSLDDCLERYAARSVSTSYKSPGIRQRAVDIVSKLGYIDRAADKQRAKEILERGKSEDDDNYNPWAKSFIH